MKKKISKKSILFIIYVCVFSFIIFFIKNFFLNGFNNYENEYIEENYIDITKVNQELLSDTGASLDKNDIEDNFNSASKLYFHYFPDEFIDKTEEYSLLLLDFFDSGYLSGKINELNIEFYEKLFDVRGKMKNATIKLFGVLKMEKQEFLGVSIHEFGHYVDLYFLEKKVLKDLSYSFYNISWEETKIIRAGQEQKDFVSGYAMTNKYEDFAESFTYYVLHNNDFLEKTKKSSVLKSKYDFFGDIIFRNSEFKNNNFSTNNEIKNYYRDITKIDFNLKKFLQYLEKGV